MNKVGLKLRVTCVASNATLAPLVTGGLADAPGVWSIILVVYFLGRQYKHLECDIVGNDRCSE